MSDKSGPPSQVCSRVRDAQRAAETAHDEVERISEAHLRSLLADTTRHLAEHVDDPELTAADRARLLRTIATRQNAVAHRHSRSAPRRRWRLRLSRRALIWSAAVLGSAAGVIGVPLRSTTERAIAVEPFVTQFEPVHLFRPQTVQPGQIVFVRRWLRRDPVAVFWMEDTHAYVTAPLPRSAVEFPDFPYFDDSFWRSR